MTTNAFDRAAEDLGNIVNLGHVNHRVPDQRLATIFYMTGLGLTRDPAMMTGVENMWVNVGDSQFHLPTGPAVVAPGIVTGLVLPDLDALRARLARVAPMLEGSRFSCRHIDDAVESTCPWGNRIRCHAPDTARFGAMGLGMAYVSFEVARGQANRIARFYREVFGALAMVEASDQGNEARIVCGNGQRLLFEERAAPADPCVDHHIQIYVANFSKPYRALQEFGAKIEESNRYQYRIFSILDIESGAPMFTLDHEVRSMTHPMYNRALVNRDAAQTARDYRTGRDYYFPA